MLLYIVKGDCVVVSSQGCEDLASESRFWQPMVSGIDSTGHSATTRSATAAPRWLYAC
jgi:hypothetical protein